MPEKSNKAALKGKNDNSFERIIDLTENKLEKLVENMITKAIKPLEAEIKELKTKLNRLIEGQNFISDKHDEMANDYKSVLTKSRKQKEENNKLNKRTDELQKKREAKNSK